MLISVSGGKIMKPLMKSMSWATVDIWWHNMATSLQVGLLFNVNINAYACANASWSLWILHIGLLNATPISAFHSTGEKWTIWQQRQQQWVETINTSYVWTGGETPIFQALVSNTNINIISVGKEQQNLTMCQKLPPFLLPLLLRW